MPTMKTIEDLEQDVQDLRERSVTLAEQAEALERQLRMVKGTRDIKTGKGEFWVGDSSSTGELMHAVRGCLTAKPRTFQELLEAVGARDNRIKGVIMRLQREGTPLVNMGTENKAIWFIPGEEALARLRRRR